jgi:hypothetical protein
MGALIPNGADRMNFFYHVFGIQKFLQASELQTLMYASLSWAGFLVLMSVRVQGHFWNMFYQPATRPDPLLLGAFCFGTTMTLLIAGTCDSSVVDQWSAPWPYIGVAGVYALFTFVVVDTIKVYVNKWIEARFEGEGNSIGEQRRQVIQVVFEPRVDNDDGDEDHREVGGHASAFTTVREQGVPADSPLHGQPSVSGANLLGVPGNPTLADLSKNGSAYRVRLVEGGTGKCDRDRLQTGGKVAIV